MEYRKSAITDCEKIYLLVCDLEGRVLPLEKFKEIYSEQVRSKNYYCIVGEENNQILAFLNLRFEEQLHHCESIAEIMEFAVHSACRSQGIGKQMFEKAVQVAETYGCTQMEVACNQLRTDTHRFYLREGMSNFHYKFSQRLTGEIFSENALGR